MLNIAEVGIKWKEEASKQDYEAIRAIGEEMQHTVSQLMDLSRADSGELELLIEPVSIGEVVHSIWNRHKAKAVERNLNVSLADFEGILWNLDRSLFERVVDNLIENAVYYSTDGGDIELSMSSEQTSLIIRNHCSGLKESDLDKLFHRFWRNDSARSSSMHSGLGLSVAAAFSQLLGLRLEASLESGDVFEIRLTQH
jgi:signal transduction histidine kinase